MPPPARPDQRPVGNANIARYLAQMAAEQPHVAAVKIPRRRTKDGSIDYLTLNFAELDAEVDAWCARFAKHDVRHGDRVLVMVQPGLSLIAVAFALFRYGTVPVFIDPGMGRKSYLACVARAKPRVLVGTFKARLVSRIFGAAFSSVKVRVPASGSLCARLTKPAGRSRGPHYETAIAAATDLAAILFTSGSTGPAKGVRYEHGMFDAQVRLIRATYSIEPGEVDLPLLPIFALFNPALGMTTIVPEIDPRKPADVDPAKIVQAIRQENVTNSFGSPTLWKKIGDHCIAKNLTLPSVRRVLCAGAPVPASLWEASRLFLSNGQLHSPYGATEALPVTTISAREIETLNGPGACVGKPLAEVDVKIVTCSDDRIATLADTQELRRGGIGEIIARGPVVTKAYDDNPPATTAAKISFSQNFAINAGVWHRMGDCGYVDEEGRIWFCGRKIERVETPEGELYTEPCEQVFRTHPRAARCALIGLGERGRQVPAIVVEAQLKNSAEGIAIARELHDLALTNQHTAAIKTFFFHPQFPVDVRHNAKIHRLTLTKWAATARAFEIADQPAQG